MVAFVPPQRQRTLPVNAATTLSVACAPSQAPNGFVASSLALKDPHAAEGLAWLHSLRARPFRTPHTPLVQPLGSDALVRRAWRVASLADRDSKPALATLAASSQPWSAFVSALPLLLAGHDHGWLLAVGKPLHAAVMRATVHTARLEEPSFAHLGVCEDAGRVLVGQQEEGSVSSSGASVRVAQLVHVKVPSLPVGGVRLEGAGGINTLRAVPIASGDECDITLAPMAVGLNFRDLLNVMVLHFLFDSSVSTMTLHREPTLATLATPAAMWRLVCSRPRT